MAALTEQGALVDVQLHNHAPEDAALRGTPGTYINVRGTAEAKRRFGRLKRANNTQKNSRRATYASRPGEKFFELDFKLILCETTYTDFADVFASGLGEELAASTLVMTAASGTINGCTIQSGNPDPVVRVGLSNGLFYIVPVKSFDDGTGALVFGYTLPALGGASITSVQNANQRAGGCFVESFAPPTSFAVESSQGDNEPSGNQVAVTGQGCIPDISLEFSEMNEHLEFSVRFMGVDWFTSPAPGDLADPANAYSQDFTVQQCDVLFQSITTPAVQDFQILSTVSGIKLSPIWNVLKGTRSRLSSGANPGSSAFNVKRTAFMTQEELITIGMRLADPDWIAARTAKTHGMLFFVWYDGDPGQTGTRAISLLYRDVTLDDDPVEDDNGGISAHTLAFKVEDPTDAFALDYETLRTRCVLSFWNN